MVQVEKHHLLPISLCFGYIPILILLPSVSYNRVKRYEGVSDQESFLNGLLFLYFFPFYIVCFLFIGFHILTIFYKNKWTAVLLNSVASLGNLFAGLGLGSILGLYRFAISNYEIVYQELKAAMAGVILLVIIQILGYSSWPGFAKVKCKCLQITQRSQQHGEQHAGSTKIIIIVIILTSSIISGGIGLLCHTAGAISYTVAIGDDFKDSDLLEDDLFMFWLVSLYMVIGLYVLLVPLLILSITLPYEKYSWLSYSIAPLNCLLQVFVGISIFEALLTITMYSQDEGSDSAEKKIFYSLISVSVGSILLALSTVVCVCYWSLKLWLNINASTSAEPTQHQRNIVTEQTVPLIRNEDNETPWIGNVPYPMVLTRDTRYHDDDKDDNDDDEKLLQY